MIENTSWNMVYENDKDGNAIAGDVNNLINAIHKGKEVRLMVISDEQEYITEAQNIWVRNGIVHIQNTSHVSVEFNNDKLLFQNNAYHWYLTINTNGVRHMSRWYVGDHRSRGSNSDRVRVRWFVR